MTSHTKAYSRGDRLVDYGFEIEEEITRLQDKIEIFSEIVSEYPSRWLAIKLLEEDEVLVAKVSAQAGGEDIEGPFRGRRQQVSGDEHCARAVHGRQHVLAAVA